MRNVFRRALLVPAKRELADATIIRDHDLDAVVLVWPDGYRIEIDRSQIVTADPSDVFALQEAMRTAGVSWW